MATLKQLAQATSRMEVALARRNALIIQLRSRGISLQKIADACGMTRQGVKLICDASREVTDLSAWGVGGSPLPCRPCPR